MKSEIKITLADSIKDFRMPRYNELPDVGLYLEQTTKYINSFLSPLGCIEITSTMISNYVKKGLIPNPIKKQYYAEHIAYLFFIVIAKNLLSMENIMQLIEMQRNSYTAPVAYNYLCNEIENTLFYIFGLKDSLDIVGYTESEEKDMLYSLVTAAAHVIYMHACFNFIRSGKEYEQ